MFHVRIKQRDDISGSVAFRRINSLRYVVIYYHEIKTRGDARITLSFIVDHM